MINLSPSLDFVYDMSRFVAVAPCLDTQEGEIHQEVSFPGLSIVPTDLISKTCLETCRELRELRPSTLILAAANANRVRLLTSLD